MVPLKNRYPGNNESEYQAFDDTAQNVVIHIDPCLHGGPIATTVYIEYSNAHEVTTCKADHTKQRRKKRHGDAPGQEPGCYHPAKRIHCHHLHGFELLGSFHQPNFCCQCGSCPTGKQQRCQNRAEFSRQKECDRQSKGRFRAKVHQGVVALKAQHHANEQPRHHNDEDRHHAHGIELLNQQTGSSPQDRSCYHHPRQKNTGSTEALNDHNHDDT